MPRELLLLIGGIAVVIVLILLISTASRALRGGGGSVTSQQEETQEQEEELAQTEEETGTGEEEESVSSLLQGMDNYSLLTDETQITSLTSTYTVVSPSSCSASSVLVGSSGTSFGTDYLFDDDLTTSWQEGEDGSGLGVTLTMVFPEETMLRGIAFWIGNEITQEKFESNNRPADITISISSDGQSYSAVYTLEDLMGEQMLLFDASIPAESAVIRIDSVYEGTVYDDTVISELKFYGNG